ncbi:MAG: UrcA family protein [Pseudomonadota bacterium]
MITALALLLAATPLAAQDPAATARVQVSDLNLHTAAGRAELDRRLNRAVATVCPAASDNRALRQVQQAQGCRDAALATVTKQRHSALAAAGVPAIEIASNGR